MYETIARLCKEKNITIAELERACGIANGTIGKWRDSTNDPRFSNVKAVADYFGVTVDALLNGDQPTHTEKIPRYREFREKAGMTLNDVTRATRIPQARLESVEFGTDELADEGEVQKLADLYGCSPDQLREIRLAEPAMYVQDHYFMKRDEKIDALAREILRISHEQGLSLKDIRLACEQCERFVLQSTVPEDSRGWISRKYSF